MLEAGSVGHNQFLFYPDAIDISLGAGDWERAERYCFALEDFATPEPLPWSDFFYRPWPGFGGLGAEPPG
jgi:hypothetical protein